MAEFGHYSMFLAWLLSLFAIGAGCYAGYKRSDSWFYTTRNATLLVCVCSLLSLFSLGYLFYYSDFSNQYVWQYSNRDMQGIYRFSAIWGGMDGSMLLWCAMLSVSAGLLAFFSSTYPRNLMPWVLAVMNTSSVFFLTIVVFYTNPFRYVNAPYIPPDGNGLNPLLQNPYMAVHPPMLYAGFTTLAVPYAFCMGALLSGSLSNQWIRLTRNWTLVAWGFLTAGIMLGGHWAYLELGWGGFWAWDPVENASFLPWLTATAFLHSVMIQERKDMLKFWNIWLVVLTYGLTVFGTFLTRSGIVQSVHAFASTDIGEVFLQYLAFIFVFAAILVYRRRSELKPARQIESLFSREAAFLLNNLVLLSIMFATLWGVMFPILSEAVTGEKQTVSIPFFNAVNVPLFLLLLFLMGVGTLIAWRRASWNSVKRTFLWPFVSSLLVACILVWAGVNQFYPVLSYALSFFAIVTVFGEYHRGIRAIRTSSPENRESVLKASSTLLRRHRSRYGGYIIHIGAALAAISITASMAHKVEQEFTLNLGEEYSIGRFIFKLNNFESFKNPNYLSDVASVSVSKRNNGELLTVLKPEKRLYLLKNEPTTEVALRSGPREDVYLALAGVDPQNSRVSFKVFINPLQIWLWVSGLIMIFGCVVVLWPRYMPSSAKSFVGVGQEI